MPAKRRGRPRMLDRKKKLHVLDLVARGAATGDAAAAVGVSMRTVQRECRWDPDFNEELRPLAGSRLAVGTGRPGKLRPPPGQQLRPETV